MFSKICAIFILIILKFQHSEEEDNFFTVSTSRYPPHDCSNMVSEILAGLDNLTKHFNPEEKNKKIFVKDMEFALETYKKHYDKELKDLKNQVVQIKEEINEEIEKRSAATEMTMKRQLKQIQTEITSELIKDKMEMMSAFSECPSNNDLTIQSQGQILVGEINSMKTLLAEFQKNLVEEIQQSKNWPLDCKDIQRMGSTISGVYKIRPQTAHKVFSVWCDMTTDGGGWTQILHRFDGTQNFYRKWNDYKNGFGSPFVEFWIGLEHLYELTNSRSNELLFELVDWDSKKVYAKYDNFKIGNELEKYSIKSLGSYSGDAGDSFKEHLGKEFGTMDKDPTNGCAASFKGAWWYVRYESCYYVHLTGRYFNGVNKNSYDHAIHWALFHGFNYNLKEVKMMIRPKNP